MANMIFLDALNYQAETPLEKCIVLYWAKSCNGRGLIAEQKPFYSIDNIANWCNAEPGDVFDTINVLHEKQILLNISNTPNSSPVWKLNFGGLHA